MAKSVPVHGEGVRIIRPSLADDPDEETILRGVIDLDSLPRLRTDHYQRDRLSNRMNRQIQRAIDMNTSLPDITLGMRGDRFDMSKDGAVELLDPVFIIDGFQRVSTIREHLKKFPGEKIRLGATVYFNSTERTERARFHALNLYATRVSANVILRNSRQDIPILGTLYGLSVTDKNFPMYRRISWKQGRARDELITAVTYVDATLRLHAHKAATRQGRRHMEQALNNLARSVNMQVVRENTITYWELIDHAWGVRNLGSRTGTAYLATNFLHTLSRVLSDHANFWDGDMLVIPTELKRRFKLFKPHDPEIERLSSGHGSAIEMLRILMVDHLNRHMRKKLVPRIVAAVDQKQAAE